LLAQAGIAASSIKGYETNEVSHSAAAHAVAAGSADVALGIAIAAQSQGLDFVPLVQENYHLVCLKSALQEPSVQALLALLQGREWQNRLGGIAGYTPSHCGQVLSLRDVLPWWSFARQKPHKP
jgi:molybdate-binding protein